MNCDSPLQFFCYYTLTFTAIKGGVGKTTMTLNYSDWLVRQGNKVLLIDLDHQCNLTTIFEPTRRNNTIAEAFKDEEDAQKVQIDHIKENLDLIAGYFDLDEIGSKLENNSNKEMMLYMWLKNNYDILNIASYDYILIDTHPDFGTITKNAIALSNYLISPITPSEHGYSAKFDLETRLEKFRKALFDYKTGETYVDAKLFFVANMVKHNTSTSRELLDHIKDDKTVLTIVPEREIFNKATTQHLSVFDFSEIDTKIAQSNKKAIVEINNSFNAIYDITK
ncbi:MAG: ParA family protein [Streptococcus suis]